MRLEFFGKYFSTPKIVDNCLLQMSCSRDPNLNPEDDIHIVESDDEDLEFVEDLEGQRDFDSGDEDRPPSQELDG